METKTLKVTILCKSYYNASIEVPAHMNFNEAIAYVEEHLDEIPVTDLEYVGEDKVDVPNCEFA